MKNDPVEVVAAVFYRQRDTEPEILFFRRATHVSGAGFWELPGGKLEPGESHEQALHREIKEELAVQITIGPCLGQNLHSYPNKTVLLHAYLAELAEGSFQLKDHDGFRWLKESDIKQFSISMADVPLLPTIYNHLKRSAQN